MHPHHALRGLLLAARCLLLAMAGVLSAGPAWAAEVPAPPLGQLQGTRQTVDTGPLHVTIDTYHSRLPAGLVKKFYMRELSHDGWAQSPLPIPVPDASQLNMSRQEWEQMFRGPEDVLYFRKDEQLVAIRLESDKAGTTVYVNDMGALPKRLPAAASENDAPALAEPATAHDPIGLPVYPTATRVMATGHPADGALLRMYQTPMPENVVLNFYAAAMAQSGWSVVNRRTKTQTLALPTILRTMLAKQQGQAIEGDVQTTMTNIEFQRPHERCQLLVMHIPQLGKEPAQTDIAVQWKRLSSVEDTQP